jgi:hypothetical protein
LQISQRQMLNFGALKTEELDLQGPLIKREPKIT